MCMQIVSLAAVLGMASALPAQKAGAEGGGIQWYAVWEDGLRESRASGKPILFLSAAPHCAGVSGIW